MNGQAKRPAALDGEVRRPRVLIADDNGDLARSLAQVLGARGADVTVVEDGQAALDQAENGAFDVALVDLKLPRRSGIDVLRELRETRSVPRLVAMTGYDSKRHLDEAAALGVTSVLRKPLDIPALLEELKFESLSFGGGGAESARVAELVDGRGEPSEDSAVFERFDTIDALLAAASEGVYDAVVLPAAQEDLDELVADLGALDLQLAVVHSRDPALLAAAVERTRTRRQASAELDSLREAFLEAPGARVLVAGEPPRLHAWSRDFEDQLGYHRGELADRPLADLEAGSDGGLIALVAQIRESGAVRDRIVRLRLRRGSALPTCVHGWGGFGELDSVLISLAPPERSDAHVKALQMVGATTAGVAHEMRNTLAGVGNSLSVLRRWLDEGTEAARVLEAVIERTNRASEVMNDLLDFARPLAPQLRAVPARLVLAASAEQVSQASGDTMTVDVSVPDPTLRLLVDPAHLQMLLVNLGNNAAQAGATRLQLRCERIARFVEIAVDDDGPGVPIELRDRIFDPFFTTRSRGSGLGLAIVRKVVEAHGGTIELLPAGPGSRFRIRLPPRPSPTQEMP